MFVLSENSFPEKCKIFISRTYFADIHMFPCFSISTVHFMVFPSIILGHWFFWCHRSQRKDPRQPPDYPFSYVHFLLPAEKFKIHDILQDATGIEDPGSEGHSSQADINKVILSQCLKVLLPFYVKSLAFIDKRWFDECGHIAFYGFISHFFPIQIILPRIVFFTKVNNFQG